MSKPLVFSASRRIRFIVYSLTVLSLQGCVTDSPSRDTHIPQGLPSASPAEQRLTAEQAYHLGRYQEAAAKFNHAADTASDPIAQQDNRLRAAEAHARASNITEARQLITNIRNAEALTTNQLAFLNIIRARLMLLDKKLVQAQALLPQDPTRLSAITQIHIGFARADIHYEMGRVEQAVLARISIDHMLKDAEARRANHRSIWNTMQNIPSRQLNIPPADINQVARGWWELAILSRHAATMYPAQRRAQLENWQQTYPLHPANNEILPSLSQIMPDLDATQETYIPATPRNVALLLPTRGRLQAAGRSILNGFKRAADQTIMGYRIYDTSSNPSAVIGVYQQAVREGADLIIGPLDKETIIQLATSGQLTVPVLALNTIPDMNWAPPRLFQFGLNPEDEARQAAEHALSRGLQRAAILHADSELGYRLATAFAQHLERSGGQVIRQQAYPPSSNSLKQDVKHILQAGTARPLWEDIRPDSRRHPVDQQIDMIFITGNPRDARLIRPMIRFHRALDLPVYSTAQVYSKPNTLLDKDLDGLVFCDIPIVLQGDTSISGTQRLAALGEDAFLLAREIGRLASRSGTAIPGVTGRLSLGLSNKVTRGLECAVVKAGKPTLPNDAYASPFHLNP